MPDYKYPSMSVNEYLRALMVLLRQLDSQNKLGGMSIDDWYNYAADVADLRGVSAELPFYETIIAPRAERKWEGEYTEAYEEALIDFTKSTVAAQKAEQELVFAQKKFQADEDWRTWQKSQAEQQQRAQESRDIEGKRQWDIKAGIEQAQTWNEQRRMEIANRANLLAQETQRQGAWQGVTRQQAAAQTGNKLEQQYAEQWNREMERIQSGTAPRDWVKRETARMAENPWQAAEAPNIPEDIMQEQQNLAAYQKAEKTARDRYEATIKRDLDPLQQVDYGEVEAAKYSYDMAKTRRENSENWIQETSATPEAAPSKGTTARFGYAEAVGANKPQVQIPGELQKAFGITKFGQEITTPSPQQWRASSPTSQEQLWGYAEAMGKNPEDIMWQMQSALPNQPSNKFRWTPARQMA